jgi:4-aminobutyrate aminotransferase-like enzyme
VSHTLAGDELPHVAGPAPGPRSAELARRLAAVESPNITCLDETPIFWTEARGAAVRDADDNVYVDLTAGFGVAHAGHANSAVTAAISQQAALLAHGLGDVHPPEPKVRLLERLAAIAPGDLGVTILAGSGAEAVEAALKTAAIRTRRTGIIAFEGAYHGLTYGALAATWRPDFRTPFAAQLFDGVRFVPWPVEDDDVAYVLDVVRRTLREAESSQHPVGAIIAEPILGRGGIVVPGDGFLAGLRDLADGQRTLLILDEVYTGCGRTGRWFACEHDGVVPDVLVVGKALSGSLPISAAIGTPDAMAGWPPSAGEAIHTSTFLGNPVACAAALAQLDYIEEHRLLERTVTLGQRISQAAGGWAALGAGPARGRGLLQGVPVAGAGRALAVARYCLSRGVLLLAEGPDATVLALTPPAVISDAQLDAALAVVEAALREVPR